MTLPVPLPCVQHYRHPAFHGFFTTIMLKTEAGGSTVSPGGQATPGTMVGGPTALPGSPTTHRIEVIGPTATPGGQTTRPFTVPASPTSSCSTVPHAAPTTPPTPHAALTSMNLVVPPMTPASQLYPQHYSCHPRAAREPPALHLHQQSLLVKAIPTAPPINTHLMTTRVKWSFQLLADRLTLSSTSTPTLSSVPYFVRATLIDPN
jgi:hypothetical protein